MKFSKDKLILVLILLLAATFRFYNINWDSGHQLHPDERAILMAVDKLKFPNNVNYFLSPQSSWNPKFFAYGSFPMYLLRVTGDSLSVLDPTLSHYPSLHLVGRVLSALADLFSVFLIYKIARKLFNTPSGLLAAFFYTISVLPIQLSHFFAVDTLLTCFTLATLYSLLRFYEKPSLTRSLMVGFLFGLALATKISAVVLILSIGLTLTADFLLIFMKSPHKIKHWLPLMPASIKRILTHGVAIVLVTFLTFAFFEPYALIDFQSFWSQTLQQSELTKNPFYFPYTLQYVGKIPYIYELKNVFFWGLGPVLGTLAFSGLIYFTFLIFKKERNSQFAKEFIIFVFFLSYLIVVGRFSVGFMRYMLPLYPLLALFAALLVYRIIVSIQSKNTRIVVGYLFLVISVIWPLTFLNIYTRNNTRVDATFWIRQNIPVGKVIAIEHWDDGLPLAIQSNYQMLTLNLYDPDTEMKWAQINTQLQQADYVIIASNRLYTPLLKLTDCRSLPINSCFPMTATYYKNLFAGNSPFQKVAEFTNYPNIPIFNIPINDESADESFTVYDHPKVMIFKKR
ncbi:MAG TPA: glycosyltransferase family 39 protein [Candidatus Limnocylindrales bacterium]|nr:glycosyltransferase family 39 protein [Candidatus Limnocylindrales bacterium]